MKFTLFKFYIYKGGDKMVTLNMNTDLTSAAAYEWRGKSTDTKPI